MIVTAVACAALLLAQRERMAPAREVASWEYRALIPREYAPGQYAQVEWYDVMAMGDQGWELVSVAPWVIRNDERKYHKEEQPRVITQNYLAYYFKRPKTLASRGAKD